MSERRQPALGVGGVVMERRAHWTDDLIGMVLSASTFEGTTRSRLRDDEAHAIIAAVEDWHRDRWTGVCESPEEVVRELKQAQAAMQRVRELHHFVVDEIETREGPEDVQHCSECGYIPTDEEPCPTIRTLDGAT